MDTTFVVIVTVYNSEKYIGNCISSILNQTYKNFTLIVVDDCSTDETLNIIKSFGVKYHRNQERIGSAVANIVKGINLCPGDREDVIVIIDGDDWLFDNDVLDYLNQVYQNPSTWLTYGQFTPLSKKKEMLNYCKPLMDTRHYRKKGRWVTSHPKTMKRKLWDRIKDEDLRDDNGEYFKRFEDTAYMYPAVEMAGIKHIRCITKVLYVYNDLNSACSLNEYSERQRLKQIMPIKWCILRKPCYNEVRDI